jgi:GH24 family phage-related lysozyme (muramidase)
LNTSSLKTGLKAFAVASLVVISPCTRVADKAAVGMPKNKITSMLPMRSLSAVNDAIPLPAIYNNPLKDSFAIKKIGDLSQKYDEPFLTQISDFVSSKWIALFHDEKIKSAQGLIKTFEAGDVFSKKIHGEKHYQVYYGEADKLADETLSKQEHKVVQPLLTVGHGHTQRGFVEIGGRKLKEGDFITENQADSLLKSDLDKKSYILKSFTEKPIAQHEKDAMLSYMFNVDWQTLAKSDSTRKVKESFFECFNKNKKGLVQSKFNIVSAGGVEHSGLIQRRLVEMSIFGNGEIYKDADAQQTFISLVKKLNDKKGIKGINQVIQTLKNYGIAEVKAKKLKAQMLAILHPQN